MRKRYLALTLAVALLLACAACGGGREPEPAPGPFYAARRILLADDLAFDSEDKLVVEPGEALVSFTYMETFDEEAWRESTIPQVAWAMQADHATADTGKVVYRWQAENEGQFFTRRTAYVFGSAATEIWMLQEEEYAAALDALLAAARGADEKPFWLVPDPNGDPGSYHINSYLPEQLRPRAEAVFMSTELMREHFPFLGRE